ncbi:MAG: 3-alpha,7-alpha, 12-alpha-trihydroxy-5-beta-cholest-24-enoyl-CoA hydratase [Actinobacteria bacterium]|nr:3-alpha,7-alpha, 12-alpha-trihydroxy-5-beta-cholest-24-enoyl-CoA hydratase [Actinomycetota bacterium]
MPIDPGRVVGAVVGDTTTTWDEDRVILYHLALGAGRDPVAPGELEYCYEPRLKVLPSFGVLPAQAAIVGLLNVPGLSFNPMLLLHGEQELEVLTPRVPPAAAARSVGRIAAVYDKGKAALLVVEVETATPSGEPLFRNRFLLFLRGEGGFGGEPGPRAVEPAPEEAPDLVVESPTLPQQALLYRLLGDKNPLHADPEFAAVGGFARPILHGLCSYGIACKAVVDGMLGGETTAVASYRARFAGVVVPGDTIVTSMWRRGDRIHLAAANREKGTPILSNAVITLR